MRSPKHFVHKAKDAIIALGLLPKPPALRPADLRGYPRTTAIEILKTHDAALTALARRTLGLPDVDVYCLRLEAQAATLFLLTTDRGNSARILPDTARSATKNDRTAVEGLCGLTQGESK